VIDVYASDEEKVEAIKRWWKENGAAIVIGVVVGVGGLFGWQAWTQHRQSVAEQASSHYTDLIQAFAQGQTDEARRLGGVIREEFGSTPYAALSALAVARVAAERGRLDEARESLQWVAQSSPDPALAELASVRLARVLIAAGEPEAALAQIGGITGGEYAALANEVRGDAHVALGQPDQAREAYDKALLQAGSDNEFLRMKRDDLGAGGA
jgi:predicted negative regulator of RcsB-dependent stress response